MKISNDQGVEHVQDFKFEIQNYDWVPCGNHDGSCFGNDGQISVFNH